MRCSAIHPTVPFESTLYQVVPDFSRSSRTTTASPVPESSRRRALPAKSAGAARNATVMYFGSSLGKHGAEPEEMNCGLSQEYTVPARLAGGSSLWQPGASATSPITIEAAITFLSGISSLLAPRDSGCSIARLLGERSARITFEGGGPTLPPPFTMLRVYDPEAGST
jgi:hypothetical protein